MRRVTALVLSIIIVLTTISNSLANTIKLPSQVVDIEEEAFMGNTSISEVVLPYGTKSIGNKAFSDSGIERIYIPGTVDSIAEDAFSGADDVVIYAPAGSYAQEYAEIHEYLWQDAGNIYRHEQFLETKELYDELEYADEDTLYYGDMEFSYIDDDGIEDDDLLALISEYNELEEESYWLLQEQFDNIYYLSNAISDLGDTIEDASMEYTDDGVSYSGDGFSYYVNSSIAEDIGEDYEIGSVTSTDDGNMSIELISNGKTYTITGNVNGIAVTGTSISLISRSGSDVIASYSVDSKVSRGGPSEGSESIFDAMLAKVRGFDGALLYLNQEIEKSFRNAQAILALKKLEYTRIRDFLSDPGMISDELLVMLRGKSAIAELNYKVALRSAQALEKAFSFMKGINPVASIATIWKDFTRWKELGGILEHGHPLPSERTDSEKMRMIQAMIKDIRAARTAYFCDALNSCLNLVDEISTLLAMIGSATGVGAAPGWLQKAAVFVGIKGFRAMLMSFFAGAFFSAVGDTKYNQIFATDKLLHGGVYGYVTDKNTGAPIKLVAITFNGMTAYTDSKGYYRVSIPEGSHTVKFSKNGYKDEEVTVTPIDGVSTRCDVKMEEKGVIAGAVVDAKTAEPLSGVTVIFGYYKTTTDSNGKYKFEVVPGSAGLSFSKEGYIDYSTTAVCEKGMTKIYDAALTEELPENTYRVVLTWGATPEDLDSHLYLDEFHVYWNNKYAENAELDVDDTSSYGPETITFLANSTETYNYYVHDYTNRNSSESYALANSGAKVQVYKEDELLGTYSVPGGAGVWWHVFSIVDGQYKVMGH